jgi:diguanylate cyclase (GGDEF)-like protein
MGKDQSTLTEASCKNTTGIRDLALIAATAISTLALSSAWRKWRELRYEVAKLKRTEEAIKQLAYHDSLTGLPNRRLFNDRLDVAIAYAQRNRHKLAMLLLDLDQFKDVNDTLGHSVGDKLLKAVSERLINILRKSDTVARMGGDEFMLMLPEMALEEDAAKVAAKILNAFQDPFVFEGYELRITTSIGIAIYPHDGEDSDTLVKNADIAMYCAKEQGRHKYQYYTPA